MNIRRKLLLLLLVISILPLLASAIVYHLSLYTLGEHLADNTRTLLTAEAHTYLNDVVENFQRLQERDRRAVGAALALEARQRQAQEGRPAGSYPETPEAYRILREYRPGMILRQYTLLESGDLFCYPPDDRCPDRRDPLRFPWFQAAAERDGVHRVLAPDPVTGQPSLIATIPLRSASGTVAGVTAVSRSATDLFRDLKLPADWVQKAQAVLAVLERSPDGSPAGLRVLVGERSARAGDRLLVDGHGGAAALLEQIAAGRPGTASLMMGGRESHWFFGAAADGEPFPLIIVHHEQIITQALAAERHVQGKIMQGLFLTGGLLAAVVLIISTLSVFSAGKVTRPLSQLAARAESLGGGDYQTRVEIRTGDELEELGRLFNQIGPQLQEHERMAHALALAGEIQRHLLPGQHPELSGFDIFGGGIYCDETGGDYYDYLAPAGSGAGLLGLAVGDVSGHGISAALLMASARGVLRSNAERLGAEPGRLLGELNRHLAADTDDERFMTLFYGVLEEEHRTLLWSSAGHGPVLLCRRARRAVEELPATGVPLGIMAGSDYPTSGPVRLEPGDILLVGTDGIWETREPGGSMFGTERLQEAVWDCAAEPAQAIHSAVMDAVKKFRVGERQEDDLTLVVVKVLARRKN